MTAAFAKIRTVTTEFEATELKNVLVAAGIPAFLENSASYTALSYVGSALGGIRVLVPADRLDEAHDVLGERDESNAGTEARDWRCSTCGSVVDGGFDVCWKCGGQLANGLEIEEADEGSQSPYRPTASESVAPLAPSLVGSRQQGVQRAFRVAVIGIAIVPGIAHLLSLWLLARALTSPKDEEPLDYATIAITIALDLLLIGVVVALIVGTKRVA